MSADKAICTRCLAQPPAYVRCVVPLRYEAEPLLWVRRLKFHQGLVEARLLGTLLANTVREAYRTDELPDVVVPVPSSWRRLAQRGHNQALTLALVVGKRLQVPVARTAARRARHGPAQRGLSQQARQANLSDAFACRSAFDRWRGARIAVLDDVLTTGATAQALATTLLAAGAGEIHVWCATRTPGPR
jgi:ComF family protein